MSHFELEDLLDGEVEECLERCYEMNDEGEEPTEDDLYRYQLAKDSGAI